MSPPTWRGVKRLLEDSGIEKPVLIGHSLGAAICLSFAIRHGDRHSGGPRGRGTGCPSTRSSWRGLKKDPAAIIGLIAKLSIAKENRERLSGFHHGKSLPGDPGIIYGDLFACSKLDITEAVAGIRIPALILCGADDKMTPPALSEVPPGSHPRGRARP